MALGIAAVIAVNLLRGIDLLMVYPILDMLRNTAVFAIYIGCTCLWGFTAANWASRRQIKTLLRVSTVLMLAWICVRSLRFYFVDEQSALGLTLWYAYYIPMLFLPIFGLHAAFFMGHSQNWRTPRAFYALYVLAGVLGCAILTNNLHGLAFRIAADGSYTYGPLYAAAALWMGAFSLLTVLTMVRKSSLPSSRRRAWQPFAVIVVVAVYCLLYTLDTPFNVHIVELTAVFCVAYVLLWESCLSSGLVVTSNNQEELFELSRTPVSILDKSGEPVFISAAAQELHASDEEGFRIRTALIRGGFVQWAEDVRELEQVQAELIRVAEELQQGNELLEAENAARRRRAAAQSQSALYDQMSDELSEHLDALDALIEDARAGRIDAGEALRVICVMGAYVKRRSNLLILGQEAGSIEAMELQLCLAESIKALRSCGIEAELEASGGASIPLERAKELYDSFEDEIERTLGGCAAYRIRFQSGPGEPAITVEPQGGEGA